MVDAKFHRGEHILTADEARAVHLGNARAYTAPVGTQPGDPGWRELGRAGAVSFRPQVGPTRVTIEHEGEFTLTRELLDEMRDTAASLDTHQDFEEIQPSGYSSPLRRVPSGQPVTRITNLAPHEAVKLLTTAFQGVGDSMRKLSDAMRGGTLTMKVQLEESRGLFQMVSGLTWRKPRQGVPVSALHGGSQHSGNRGGRRGGTHGGKRIRAH